MPRNIRNTCAGNNRSEITKKINTPPYPSELPYSGLCIILFAMLRVAAQSFPLMKLQ
jgi:hypothetical protein